MPRRFSELRRISTPPSEPCYVKLRRVGSPRPGEPSFCRVHHENMLPTAIGSHWFTEGSLNPLGSFGSLVHTPFKGVNQYRTDELKRMVNQS